MGVKIYHAGFTISTKEIENDGILLYLYDLYVHLCVKFGIMSLRLKSLIFCSAVHIIDAP